MKRQGKLTEMKVAYFDKEYILYRPIIKDPWTQNNSKRKVDMISLVFSREISFATAVSLLPLTNII